MAPNSQHLAALSALLHRLFLPGELHRLLNTLNIPGAQLYADLSQDLPPYEHAAPKAYFFQAAQLLLQRGMVAEALFGALEEARPLRAADVRAVRELLAASEAVSLTTELSTRQQENPFAPYTLEFVGRGHLIDKIEQKLSRGQSTLLIGGRRAGKTALLDQLSADRVGRDLVRVDVSLWDLNAGEAALLRGLGQALGGRAQDRRQVEVLLSKRAPLALLIDEFDRVLEARWVGSTLAWLRAVEDSLLKADIALLLVGGPQLARYRDPQRYGSPALNTTEAVYLEALDRGARDVLLERLGRPLDREALYDAVGGHPWLLTRTLGRVWDGASLEDALDDVFGQAQANIETWRRQLGERGLALMRRIASGGVKAEMFRATGPLKRLRAEWELVQSICLVEQLEDQRIVPSARLVWELVEAS